MCSKGSAVHHQTPRGVYANAGVLIDFLRETNSQCRGVKPLESRLLRSRHLTIPRTPEGSTN